MRKKLIMLIIFLFIGVSIYLNCFIQEKSDYRLALTEIGQNETSQSIVISTENIADEDIYDIISDVLKEYNANLYCFDVEQARQNSIYTKYVLINNMTLFDDLKLDRGRFFREAEVESDVFVSTIDTTKENQIGLIPSFDKTFAFQIKTMKSGVCNKQRLFLKAFVLQMKDVNDFEAIQSSLKEMGIVITKYTRYSSDVIITPYMVIATCSAIFVLLLVVLYDLIKSYKQIGIEKMLGYDILGIWSSRVFKIMLMEITVFLIVGMLCSIILFDSFNIHVIRFLGSVSLAYLAVVLLSLGMILIPFLYVQQISVSDVVKNNRPFKQLIRFNMGLKCIITTLLIILLCLSYTQIKMVLVQRNDKFKNWEKMKDYACIHELSYWDESFDSLSEENMKKWKEIYMDFNAKGAILADFSYYSPLYEEEHREAQFPNYYEVRVNPNYLKMFPVKDAEGQPVQISESEERYIVLIPEKYKSQEKSLQEYFEDGINDSTEKDSVQEVKIIWIEDNQKIFSVQLDIGIEQYNTIEDPLIEVLTEANGTVDDYMVSVAYTGDPFKIKVEEGNDIQAHINEVCSQYFDLTQIRFPTMSVYESMEEQIKMANDLLIIYITMAVILVVAGVSIVMQSIYSYMEQKKKVLAIKKFLGYRFWDKYISYFATVIVSYLTSTAIAYLFIRESSILLCTAILMIFEVLASVIYITIVERDNVIQITKGG